MPLEIKAKIIHTLVFPITIYRCKSWIVKVGREKSDSLEIWFWKESSVDTLDQQKDYQVGPGAN